MTASARAHEPAQRSVAPRAMLQCSCSRAARCGGPGSSGCTDKPSEQRRTEQRGRDDAEAPSRSSMKPCRVPDGRWRRRHARSWSSGFITTSAPYACIQTPRPRHRPATSVHRLTPPATTSSSTPANTLQHPSRQPVAGARTDAHAAARRAIPSFPGPGQRALRVGASDDDLERAADAQAARVAAGDAAWHSASLHANSGVVQRETRPAPVPDLPPDSRRRN